MYLNFIYFIIILNNNLNIYLYLYNKWNFNAIYVKKYLKKDVI